MVVTSALVQLGYVTQAFFANSASFGLPQSRTRLYVRGADPSQCEIVHGPETWQRWLEAGTSSCHITIVLPTVTNSRLQNPIEHTACSLHIRILFPITVPIQLYDSMIRCFLYPCSLCRCWFVKFDVATVTLIFLN